MKELRNNPIRVLAIVWKMDPGGLENRLMDIIRNIDKSRVIIDVFSYSLERGLYDDEICNLGGKVYYNPKLTPRNMFWYIRYFSDFLLSHPEYRIIHAHQDAWCSVFCCGAKRAGVPIRIAHSRTAITSIRLEFVVKNIIKLPTKKYANYYFAVSEKAGRWLFGDKMYDEGRVQIWPNSIEAKKFYFNNETRVRVRKDNGWDGKYVVMHVGNFITPKNHPFILKIFQEIYKQDKNSILVLVGTGNKNQIINYIKENLLDEVVVFLSSRTDINELLQGADVFLFPSLFEGLPGALVEAQAAGLPCVISDTIAEEVQITPNLTIMSLKEDEQKWARSVLDKRGFERKDTRDYIERYGFDVCSLANKLCDFYEGAYKEGD